MNASPLELSYTYVDGTKLHGATDKLQISLHEDGRRVLGNESLTPEEWQWWLREMGEVGWERDR